LAALCVADAACGTEVWVGTQTTAGNNEVLEYDMNGHLLTSFATGGTGGIACMALVGNQVWVDGGWGDITRYDQSGNSLGTVTGGGTTMAVVGNQVWAYGSQGAIYRYSFDGSLVGTTPVSRNQYGIMDIYGFAQVGNVAWAGHASGPGYGVDVYDFNGNILYSLLQGQDVLAVAAAGSQVWVAADSTTIKRYDTSGNLIGSFATGSFAMGTFGAATLAVGGNQAWMVGPGVYGGFGAFCALDLSSGQIVAEYPVTGGFAEAVVVVPEPTTAALFVLGLARLILRKRRRSH
jgi:hypothetical protein